MGSRGGVAGRARARLGRGRVAAAATGAALLASTAGLPGAEAKPAKVPPPAAVVVATFDTGTNPFHPCFRRPGLAHPRQRTADYPAASKPMALTLGRTYEESLARSKKALAAAQPETLYHVPGTNLSFYGGERAATEFVDDYPHGAQASSQIACAEFGLAPDAQLLVLNWYDDYPRSWELVDWVAAQPWIDVVHLNIQDTPTVLAEQHIAALNATGKMVVLAAGNGVQGQGASYPSELSSYNAPKGSLLAGANDNGGYTTFSNLDPHVVMDGKHTVAAGARDFGTARFGGTSSASPRITGYVTRVIADARARWGHTGSGLLTIPAGRPRPKTGPLADGSLTAAELHEVVRKTANPNPHASRYDGDRATPVIDHGTPQPADLPFAFYPKMGYGEVSEHTLPDANAVLNGTKPMPSRPVEDAFYAASEAMRE